VRSPACTHTAGPSLVPSTRLQAQFYPESFVLYNMCNGHAFNDHGRALLAAHIDKCVCRGRARMDAMPLL
jgi:hypothetical protein